LTRIVHITDSHHKVDHPQLARAVEVINALDPPADLVVHGGDVINGYADAETMHRQATQASKILSNVRAPLLVTCCNHDTHGEPCRGRIFSEHFHSRWVQDATIAETYVLAISGNVDDPTDLPRGEDDPPKGPYRVGQPWSLGVLHERLGASKARVKLVFTHKPILPLRGELRPEDPSGKAVNFDFSKYAHAPQERQEHMAVLKEHGVQAQYAGHVHFNAHVHNNGLHCIATAATQSYPGEIRLIDVQPDSIHHTMQAIPGGEELWVRWRNVTDADHPTVREFYRGLHHERDFRIPL
jgi:hypothetical protein